MGEAVVAGGFEVGDELGGGDVAGVRASGRTAQTAATQGRWVRVCHSWARSNQRQGPTGCSMLRRCFEGEQCGVADEQGGVGVLEHGDGVGWVLEEGGLGAEEFAEEDLGVGEGAAGGGVGGYGADCGEGVPGVS